jgi:hypothetical protein
MAVSRVCYATREDVQRAPDFRTTAQGSRQIDRAIQSASDLIEAELHRVFYPRDTTYKFDWPDNQGPPPWRFWFNQWDLVSATLVESPHGTTIPLGNVIFRPVNRKPGWPFTYMELDISSVSVFQAGATPQLAIWVTGTWGFTADTDPAGILAAAIVSTTAITITVSDGSAMGVGDMIIADSERMLVTEKAAVTTGQTNLSGATTADESDVAITVTSGAAINLGEVLLLGSERLLVTDVTGNVVTVIRQWDGTVLATHNAATTLNAYRSLTVARGQYGTTAATHSNSAPLSRHRPPALIRDLCIAEGVNRVLQETSGYSRTVGESDSAQAAPGDALAELWDEATTAYGRRARSRAI